MLVFCFFVFFFSLPDIKASQLNFEKSSKKLSVLSSCDFLDSTDRNYFVKLWAKLSAKKTPVVRRNRWGEGTSEGYIVSDEKVV